MGGGQVWCGGREPPSEPLLWSLCSRPWAGPREDSWPGRWPVIRHLLSHLGSTLGRATQRPVGNVCVQQGRGVEGWRRLIQALLWPLCLLSVGRPCRPLASVSPSLNRGLDWLAVPLVQVVGGPFLSPWASGKPCPSLPSSAPRTCPVGAPIFSASPRPRVRNVGAVRSRSVMSDSLQPCGLWPARLLCPWDSPGKSTGVGCPALLQGIFPTQGSNQGLLYRRQILYCLSHQGSPRILEWVACSFSRGSSQLKNRTGVSCIADSLPAELPIYHVYLYICICIYTCLCPQLNFNWLIVSP